MYHIERLIWTVVLAGVVKTFIIMLRRSLEVAGVSGLVWSRWRVTGSMSMRPSWRCPHGLTVAATVPTSRCHTYHPETEGGTTQCKGSSSSFIGRGIFFSRRPQQMSFSFLLVRTRSWIRVCVPSPQDLGFLPNTGSKSGFS